MNTFLMIVAAVVLAQFIVGVIGLSLVLNKGITKWYTKKVMKMMNRVTEELVDMIEEEGL